MPQKKERKRRKQKGKTKIFIAYSIVSFTAFLTSAYLFYLSSISEPVIPYSGSKECRVYDENDSLAAYATVTLKTNTSVPQSNSPINVTLEVNQPVPLGKWIYAVLEGATAAFPDKEPADWDHEVEYAIVLKSHDRYAWGGSRIMNYSFGQNWDIFLHVANDTVFITHNIPEDPTPYIEGISMDIYTIPNAVHIASEESIIEAQAREESKKSDLCIKGILAIVPALGFLIAAFKEKSVDT
jgi:hypothetical protein